MISWAVGNSIAINGKNCVKYLNTDCSNLLETKPALTVTNLLQTLLIFFACLNNEEISSHVYAVAEKFTHAQAGSPPQTGKKKKKGDKNPAYGRHRISRPMRIEAPIFLLLKKKIKKFNPERLLVFKALGVGL